jgi:hypothetical protein
MRETLKELPTVIVWESVVMNMIVVTLQLVCYDPHLHITFLDGHSNFLILLKMPTMQWQILILRPGVMEGYTVWHYTILQDRCVQISPEAHPASCTMRTVSVLGVKWLGCGNYQPPPSSTELVNIKLVLVL